MKPGTVLLFVASILCATALTPTVLQAAQLATVKKPGDPSRPRLV